MDISNEELFNSALSDEQPQDQGQQVQETAETTDQQPRDEQGRFATKTEQDQKPDATTQAKPADQQQRDEGQIPAWRLREMREERDELRRQLATFQQQRFQPQPEKPAKPDLFEKPDEFVRMGVQEAVDPVKAEIASIREYYSRERAIDKHGEEKVTQAFQALDQAASRGDRAALAVVQAVKQSMDPFGDIVKWHTADEIGSNPEAFFQRRLEEALKDEKFKGELLAKLQPPQQEKPRPVFSAPSLNRAATAAPALEEGGDFSNESLFSHAMRA